MNEYIYSWEDLDLGQENLAYTIKRIKIPLQFMCVRHYLSLIFVIEFDSFLIRKTLEQIQMMN